MTSKYQVGPDTVVTLSYAAFGADGEAVGESEPGSPLLVLFGHGQLMPSLEQAIEGLSPGQSRRVVVEPHEGYGERNPAAIIELDRSELPPDAEPGDRFEMENEQGHLLVFRVLDVDAERVVLDTNHPLAGQAVRFDLTIEGVRPAGVDELRAARVRLQRAAGQSPADLIVPERLLLGGTPRYERPKAVEQSRSPDAGPEDDCSGDESPELSNGE